MYNDISISVHICAGPAVITEATTNSTVKSTSNIASSTPLATGGGSMITS